MLDEYQQLAVSTRFISYLRDFLLDQGLEPDAYLAQYDSLQQSHELSPPLNIVSISTLFEDISKRLKNLYFGFDLANNFHYENSSLIVNAMLSSKDVHTFFNTVVKYDKYVDSAIELNFSLHGSESCFEIEIFSPKGIVTNQLYLYLISFIILSLKKVTREAIPINKIMLVNKELSDILAEKLPIYAPIISYSNPKNKLYFDSHFLKQRLFSSNALMHEILCSALDNYFSHKSSSNSIIDAVRREILIQNNNSVASISTVSKGLNITKRTLSRKLSEFNMTFTEVKQKAILERSKYYLTHTNMTIAEIAFELGYSETSAFGRAFKRFYNESPQYFREK